MMSTNRLRRQNAGTVLLAAALAASQQVMAGVYYDVRFVDGTHSKFATAGDTFTLELWARVSGTDGNNLNDGIWSSLLTIQSTQANGGGITNGGLSAVSISSDFQSFSGTTALHQSGSGSDLNSDGVMDWGSTSTSSTNTNYLIVRAGGMVTGSISGQPVSTSTWEFRLATFTVDVASTGVGSTSFNVVKPNATGPGISATYAVARVDNVPYNVASNNATRIADTFNNSIGVTFLSSGPSGIGTAPWDGGPAGTGAEWTDAANWGVNSKTSIEAVPGVLDIARFASPGSASSIGIDMAGATNNGPANQRVGSIAMASDIGRDITIENSSATNGVLTLNSVDGVLVSNESPNNNLTIKDGAHAALNVAMVISGSIKVDNPSATVSISSAISGGTNGLTKTGLGLLNLSAPNTYTGPTAVSAGTLNLLAGGSLNSAVVSVAGGSIANVAGSLNPSTALTANGTINFSSPSQTLASISGSGAVTLQATTLTVGSGSFGGNISGNGSLIKSTGSSLTLSGTNSYTGGTTIFDQSLVGNSSSLKGAILLNNANATFDEPAGTSNTSVAISGNGSFTKAGPGTLNVTAPQTYTGGTTIDTGTLNITSTGSLASSSIFVSSGAMNISGLLSSGPAMTNFGRVTFSNSNQTISSLRGFGLLTLNTVQLTVLTGNFSGPIDGTGGLIKAGNGSFTWSGIGSYSGGTTILGGTLVGTAANLKGAILNNAHLRVGTGGGNAFSATVSGTGDLTYDVGGGAFFLKSLQSYSGITKISFGDIRVTAPNILPPASTFIVNDAIVIDAGNSQTIGSLTGTGLVNIAATLGGTPTLSVGANDSSNAFTGTLIGAGNLTKIGAGDLTLSGSNTSFTGAATAIAGRLIFTSPSNASAYRAATGGTLRFAGAPVNLTTGSLRADAGGTIEYSNATVTGGSIGGPGSQNFIAATNTLNGVTVLSGSTIEQNAASNFNNVISSGQIMNNASLNWHGGSIGAAGVLTVNNTANLSAVDSIGVITVNSGGTLNNSDTHLVAGGGSRTTINAGGNLNLLTGTTFDVSGGLLVNNGTITGDINGYYGSLTKGAGTFNGTINLFDGARFSPGNSPGSATVGGFTFGAGGVYLFEVADATGAPGFGTDFLNIINTLTVTAGDTVNSKFLISLASLDAFDNPGAPQNFNPAQEYHWTLVHTGAGIVGFSPSLFAIDSSGFLASKGNGSFNITQSGNDLLLNFDPVPEPGCAMLLIGLTAGRLLQRGRRISRKC